MARNQILSVSLPPETVEWLDEQPRKQSEIVREALAEHIERETDS
jgi:Arc/MetJ-type ribon-helix-helix transcriptional regulator